MNEEQIQKVIQTVNTAGWREVMYPFYANRAKQALSSLALSESERQKGSGDFSKMDDAQLRAIIRECEWMLGVWQAFINAYHQNRVRDELQAQEQNGNFPAANPQ